MVAASPMSYFVLFKQELAPLLAGGSLPGGLWARLPLVTLVELKGADPYEDGHLDRLLGYTHLCRANGGLRPICNEVGAALVVPERTPALLVDVVELGLRWTDQGSGCWQLHGGLFPIHVIEASRVDAEEDDELLLFLVDQARGVDAREVN
jgi:hypothetical protein